ncbi:MAG: polymerase subunit epsilon [Actinomycetota bacterium]|nr:polymerase subunit epsilon [Actinomycetota bacterium]
MAAANCPQCGLASRTVTAAPIATTGQLQLPVPVQATIDELGVPLREVTFVVVDLETTGGSPASSGITEIGAVKVRGGEVIGEFHTLVNPGEPIPPFIAVLTGITNAMVSNAPRMSSVLPAFLEFGAGSVLVAHNAPFDLGFLKAACVSLGVGWPGFDSVDTARLARRVLTRDEAPNCKLATLARVLKATVQPTHRALDDARATVDVLHVLFERLGGLGVHSLEELRTFSGQVTPQQRRKRHLADVMPHAPGVYLFRDERGRVLYVGKAKDLRSRVRNYFTSSEMRQRIVEMVAIAHEVTPVVCATELEAEVRELRLIAQHKPPYNRRSKFPERSVWVKLTVEPFPRLSIVRSVKADGGSYLGPFGTSRSAELAVAALHEAVPLRQCRARLHPRHPVSACVLVELGRCGAPCDGRQSVDEYAQLADAARRAIETDARSLVKTLLGRIDTLAAVLRYEDAAAQRDRLAAFIRAAARGQRLAALAGCAQVVAAKATADHGYEVAVVRHGRLVAAGTVPPGAAPRPYVDALIATAESVTPGVGPTACATAEELECVLRWLEAPGVRLVEVDGAWACPAYGAGGQRLLLELAIELATDADPFGDRRGLRPVHQPARRYGVGGARAS